MDKNEILSKIRDVQMSILKVAKEIHKICEENGIKYIMMGGTFIGAIRHKGFIPWDDDIDFGMTYDQYQKFIKVIKNMNHPWIVFDIPSIDNKEYANLFIKAYDKNTTFIEHDKPNDIRGVFVDIFPVVYAKDTKGESLKELKYGFCLRRLVQAKRYNLYEGRMMMTLFSKISASMVPRTLLYMLIQNQFKRLSNQKAKYFVALDGTKKDIYDGSYFAEDFVLYDFEDTQFYGIKDYDGFLTDVFGHYMQLPPEDKRLPHHISYFNPDIPFAEYRKRQGF